LNPLLKVYSKLGFKKNTLYVYEINLILILHPLVLVSGYNFLGRFFYQLLP